MNSPPLLRSSELEIKKVSDRRNDLKFPDALLHLAALYRRGVLVPFIGSGMSMPLCTGWIGFLTKLAKEAGVEVDESVIKHSGPDPTTLYRLADMTVSALRPLPREERDRAYRGALCDSAHPVIPPQTAALAKSYWPMVITTNYDDLYWSAAQLSQRPVVLGRGREDCHRVLRALDESQPPVLWALQGFLPGQMKSPEGVVPDKLRREELSDQLVVGHQQYQRAINDDGHFRKAFSEVFRRRSVFFLGSGILEDYLINLFSEIIHHSGPGPFPHFALVCSKEREKFDSWFLQARLGIVPIFYDDHGSLPDFLSKLADAVRPIRNSASSCSTQSAMSVELDHIGFTLVSRAMIPVQVVLSYGELLVPRASNECSVISVGRWENRPLLGNQAARLLSEASERGLLEKNPAEDWVPLDAAPSYTFRFTNAPLFAVAARCRDLKGRTQDRRDLGIIPEAVCSALRQIDASGFEVVHVGAIASGIGRPWHPIHPFAQTLRGFRRFFLESKSPRIRSIYFHIVDPSVWNPLVYGRIPAAELLCSELTTHRIEMNDGEGETESYTVTLKESPTLDQLLGQCRVDRKLWNVGIVPRPTDEREQVEPAGDMVVAPTMTVVLTPRRERES